MEAAVITKVEEVQKIFSGVSEKPDVEEAIGLFESLEQFAATVEIVTGTKLIENITKYLADIHTRISKKVFKHDKVRKAPAIRFEKGFSITYDAAKKLWHLWRKAEVKPIDSFVRFSDAFEEADIYDIGVAFSPDGLLKTMEVTKRHMNDFVVKLNKALG